MASAKPLLVCSPTDTPIVNFLDGIGCAKIITDNEAIEKAGKIKKWFTTITHDELNDMGQRGHSIVKEVYSRDVVTKQYCDLINNL